MFTDREEKIREMVMRVLLRNYQATDNQYTCPAYPHYPQWWAWDAWFAAIIWSAMRLTDFAKKEILLGLKYQQPDGRIPHMILAHPRAQKAGIYLARHGLPFLSEVAYWPNTQYSPYTQNPVLARALKWINDPSFTKAVFDKVLKFYLYFLEYRDPDGDKLPSIIHPHECRDAGPEIDQILGQRWWPNSRRLTLYSHWLAIYRHCRRCQKLEWDEKKILAELFGIKELMFIYIWIDGLWTLAELAPDQQTADFLREIARQAEQATYQYCWDEKTKTFYSLTKDHQKIPEVTIASLFPLLSRTLSSEMLTSLIDLLLDKRKFWTKYPIPSVAADNPKFTPDDRSGLCRGGSMFYMNWYIVNALIERGYPEIAKKIIEKDQEKVIEWGIWELYHSLTGQGLRIPYLTASGLVVTDPLILEGKIRI